MISLIAMITGSAKKESAFAMQAGSNLIALET
jgi:hypothetical protein